MRSSAATSGRGRPRRTPREPTPVLLRTKLHPQRIRAETVERPRLNMPPGLEPAVELLVAPPGFGKSTLIAQWQHQSDRPFAWLSLDEGDNDPIVLWRYIFEAIRGVDPGIDAAAEPPARVPGGDVLKTVVPRVLNELESLSSDLVLVLDDCHRVTNPKCYESLASLLELAPHGIRLIVSSRSDPPLPFGRLRASGALRELRAADLSFTEEETRAFLNGTFRLDLSEQAVSILWDRTEGWPAGLCLAYLSLRDAPDREEFVAGFGGSSRHVVDYLSEVVLDSLDDQMRAFLLETSILERMCRPLCDAVTGRWGSRRLLAELEQANLFLVPLDDRREWYRYHHLFSELLRDELMRRDPDLVPALHRRAAQWFAEAGLTGEAIRHAVAAGAFDDAAQFLSEHYLPTLSWGGVETILGWLEAFPPRVIATDARLCVVSAWVMSFLNRRDEAQRAIAAARDIGYDGPLPDGASSLEASLSLIRAGFPWGNVGDMLAAARTAFELEANRHSMWRAAVHVMLGYALFLAGDFEAAPVYLRRAILLAPPTEQWMNAFAARSILAWQALWTGDLQEAERWAREGLDLAGAFGLSESPFAGPAYTFLGAVTAHHGDLEEADRLITRGLEQQRDRGETLPRVAGLLLHAPVRRSLGFPEEARALLAEAREEIEACVDPGILRGRLEEVSRTLTPAYRRVSPDSELTEREVDVLRLLAAGLPKREVARSLFLSYNTIHSHTKSIYRKLRAYTRQEALDRGRELGLV
jgi:ATP/maltotriose-dependent transcriptional regulator MalT